MNTEKTFTYSPEETEECGAALARRLLSDTTLPPFIALCGDLGVGKTAFVRGAVSVLSPSSVVRSPTFALVREYPAEPRPIFHFDMYRIESENDLASIGFDDYLNRGGICLVEWSEKIPFALPESHLRVTIRKTDAAQPDCREILTELITKGETDVHSGT